MAQESVGPESRCAVRCLAGCGWNEALEETTETALAGDDGDCVEEAAHAGVGGFSVIDSIEY